MSQSRRARVMIPFTTKARKFYQCRGTGNDTIVGFDEDATLQIESGTVDNVNSNGTDIFLTIGQNFITLADAAQLDSLNIVDAQGNVIDVGVIEIQGTDGDDNITTGVSNKVIRTGAGNDYISNDGDKNTIVGGDGNKTVSFGGNENVITLGNGNNNITGYGNNLTISTGNGNNYIDSNGSDQNYNQDGRRERLRQ